MYKILETFLENVIRYAVIAIEYVGVAVLIYTIVWVLIRSLIQKKKLRLQLLEGISFALELIMGGELLRTIIARDWQELLILAMIVFIRGALAVLTHWEIRHEERRNVREAEPEKTAGAGKGENSENSDENKEKKKE